MGFISPSTSMWKAIERASTGVVGPDAPSGKMIYDRGILDWRLKTASMRRFMHGKYLESLKPAPTATGYSPDMSWQKRVQPGQFVEHEPAKKQLFATIKTLEGETQLR